MPLFAVVALLLLSLNMSLFVAAQACRCSDCSTAISVTTIQSTESDCSIYGPGWIVDTINVAAISPDSSKFNIYTMTANNYQYYSAGSAYSFIPGASAGGNMNTCFNSGGPIDVSSQRAPSLYVVYECKNSFYSCPINVKFTTTCKNTATAPPPPPSPPPPPGNPPPLPPPPTSAVNAILCGGDSCTAVPNMTGCSTLSLPANGACTTDRSQGSYSFKLDITARSTSSACITLIYYADFSGTCAGTGTVFTMPLNAKCSAGVGGFPGSAYTSDGCNSFVGRNISAGSVAFVSASALAFAIMLVAVFAL